MGKPFAKSNGPARYYPVVGGDALLSNRIGWTFPEAVKPQYGMMTEQLAEILRGWLREPDFVRQQRQTLPIPNDVQRRLVDRDPGRTGLRRVKGPAGSGKSIALAARAARLAHDGKRVMMVGFKSRFPITCVIWQFVIFGSCQLIRKVTVTLTAE